jgi:CRP-like cAMP-binding protein
LILKKLVTQIRKSLAPYLTIRKVEKLETLQKEGEICKQVYFIKKGSVKQYYVIEGKEFIQNLFFEGTVAALFNNFLTQTPAESYLQAIEGTELWVLDYHDFTRFSDLNPQFTAQMTILMSKVNTHRMNLLLMSDSLMRYKKVLEHEPEIIHRVPHYMVASYLGMTPETLSRIRKKITALN